MGARSVMHRSLFSNRAAADTGSWLLVRIPTKSWARAELARHVKAGDEVHAMLSRSGAPARS